MPCQTNRTICLIAAVGLLMLLCVRAETWAVGQFAALTFGNLADWKEKSFLGHTTYAVEQEGGKAVLHAQTTGMASGLYRKVAVNSREMPVLKWSWKVSQTLPAEDPYRRSGDDFAARVYVIFPGRFFWQTRALVYVYSDKLPVGTVIPSAYTDYVAIISVASGNGQSSTWRQEARRYVEDYRSYFHRDPPDPEAVAVMTDGDNTGSRAEAWYGDLAFSKE